MRKALGALLMLVCLAACSPLSPNATPLYSNPAAMPAGQLTRIDGRVSMAADNRTLTIKFIGGPVLQPTDPCYTGYEGWARLTAEDLDLAVILVSVVHPAPGTACAAVGQERVVTVTLDAAFLGTTATDVWDGHTLDVERLR